MTQSEPEHPDGERLQKVLARAGVASRRRVEQLMQMGRVSVNGKVATEMGMRVHALRDIISVNGSVVDLKVDARYVMLHKPVGTVSSLSDESKHRSSKLALFIFFYSKYLKLEISTHLL